MRAWQIWQHYYDVVHFGYWVYSAMPILTTYMPMWRGEEAL